MTVWRIRELHLDDDERLLSIVAVVDPDIIDRLREMIGDGIPIDVLRADGNPTFGAPTMYRIELTVPQALALLRACEQLPAGDPRRIPGLWPSLKRFAQLLDDGRE